MIVNKNSELVIGIVHTVGTNASDTIDCIKDSLRGFRYSSEVIKVSRDILKQFSTEKAQEFGNEFSRISYYMDLGNRIRCQTRDDAILMKGVAAYIYERYHAEDDAPQDRKAYIIDSIKHPDEVDFLRKTYGDGFHLIGISDDYEKRKIFLTRRKNLSEEQAEELLKRDDNEEAKNGQHTRDAYQQADYFINASDKRMETQESIFRLFELLFGNAFISPTFEEYAMFRAYVASLRSADLSRQIGAVIAKGQEIIAEGVNDCPRAFGGLYWPMYDGSGKVIDEEDGRDYMLGYDSNKIEQKKIIKRILKNLELEENEENYRKVKIAGIGTLTEYGRVVHSEMEALMMCARNHVSTRGCDMYVTTFPCHNCAKHIISAGIRKVIYIEPYPKSKALEFYKKEISQLNEDYEKKVIFLPFKGVGPHRFIDLFAMQSIKWYTRIRKNVEGKVIPWEREKANLRNPMSTLSYIEIEKAAYKQYWDEIEGSRLDESDEQRSKHISESYKLGEERDI